MAKKSTKTTASGNLPALRIGSRIRCTDDGVEGRIVWANAAAVKIEWADGEKVTWKRDSLATRPIEILDADAEEAKPVATADKAEATLTKQEQEWDNNLIKFPTNPTDTPPEATGDTAAPATPAAETTSELPAAESAQPDANVAATEANAQTATAPETPTPDAQMEVAKPKRQRKAVREPKEKKPSALDAAARVLAEAGQAMTCKEMIGAMSAKGYWTSPGGKTPDATLMSAILREVNTKGEQSRFVKTAPGRFAIRT